MAVFIAAIFVGSYGTGACAGSVGLLAEFDARTLNPAEKRMLQAGLSLDRSYVGVIDGRWGKSSQAALEDYVEKGEFGASTSRTEDGAILVDNYHAAAVAAGAFDFLAKNNLSYRGGSFIGHMALCPPGEFETDKTGGLEGFRLKSPTIHIAFMRADKESTLYLHEYTSSHLRPSTVPYLVRNEIRLVTSTTQGSGRLYIRSDRSAPDGEWATTMVSEVAGEDPALFNLVTASITTDTDPAIFDADGVLMGLVAEGVRFAIQSDQQSAGME